MSFQNHAPEPTDFHNDSKEETDLYNAKNLANNISSENVKAIDSERMKDESNADYVKKLKLNSLAEMNNENLSQTSFTKDVSPLKESLVDKKHLVHSLDNKTEVAGYDSSSNKLDGSSLKVCNTTSVTKSSDEYILESENVLQKENKNYVNGKDLTDNSKDISDSIKDQRKPVKSGGVSISSENSQDHLNPNSENFTSCDKENELMKDSNMKSDIESNTDQKCNDTYTSDFLVGKRKREEFENENLGTKHLKSENKFEEEKLLESTKSVTENNSEKRGTMQSDELEELEKEIFDSEEETPDTQDDDTTLENSTLPTSETLSNQNPDVGLEFKPDDNKGIEAKEKTEDLSREESNSLSPNVNGNHENKTPSSEKVETEGSFNVIDNEKLSVTSKNRERGNLKELKEVSTTDTSQKDEDKSDSPKNKSVDDSSNDLMNEHGESSEEETLKNNLNEEKVLENDSHQKNEESKDMNDSEEEETLKKILNEEKHLENDSQQENEETKDMKEKELCIKNSVNSSKKKVVTEGNEEKICNGNISITESSQNLENLEEECKENEEPNLASEGVDQSEEIIKNNSEESTQSSLKDEENMNDIVIGESFTINEEEMKAIESASGDENEPFDTTISQVSVEEKAIVDTPTASSVGSPSTSIDHHDKHSEKKASSKSGKKYKRASLFGPPSKRRKKYSSSQKASTTTAHYAPPLKLELQLPSFLEELVGIDAALTVVRDRYNEEGKKVKVHCITFHETVLDWAMTETLLSAIDHSKSLRTRLKVKNRSHLFPESKDLKLSEIHPVLIGDTFPFAMPRIETSESTSDEEKLPLSFPLEQLCSLCPSASGYRTAGEGKKLNMKSVTFAEEPLEWAFKETFLSSFEHSPILSNLFEIDQSSKCWPDFADIILTESVNYTFPFACPNTKKYFENFLFETLSTDIPTTLRHETLQLPSIRPDLEKDLYGERDSLVRLLAVASFYKHASCIPTVRTNRKLSVSYAALVSSFRPLIVSQANTIGKILRDIRNSLLKDVTCQDSSIIPSMINGPLHCKRGNIFSHLQRLEAAVAKDPNNKLQNI